MQKDRGFTECFNTRVRGEVFRRALPTNLIHAFGGGRDDGALCKEVQAVVQHPWNSDGGLPFFHGEFIMFVSLR